MGTISPSSSGARTLKLTAGGGSGPRPEAASAATPERYSGFVIVRLSKLVPVGEEESLEELAEARGLTGLGEVLRRFSPASSCPAVPRRAPKSQDRKSRYKKCRDKKGRYKKCRDKKSAATLGDLERQAGRSAFPPLHSLKSYFRLDARSLSIQDQGWFWNRVGPEDGLGYSNAELSERMVAQLNGLAEVDLAYRELAATEPDTLGDFQLYLDRGPIGLDARWARAQLNGASGSVTLADLEQGFRKGHEDLPEKIPSHGDNRHDAEGDYLGDHGTAVLSQLGAKKNDLGIVGIATGVGKLVFASHFREGAGAAAPGSNGQVAAAIEALLTGEEPALRAGDVLLLEVQRSLQPCEVDPLDFDAIRLAVSNGVVVVQAAGNGGVDLDRLSTVDGRSLDRRSPAFVDSGAILVGAARATASHDRAPFSNYGSRVDCFAWGEGVVAAGYGDLLDGDDESLYTDTFSGTSSAAPMIAGAAALVQGTYQENAGREPDESVYKESAGRGPDESWKRLSPLEMRTILSNPATGTAQGDGVPGSIGVMPDLRAILEEALAIVPKIYLRDHEGDTGETPYRRRAFDSPDIVRSPGQLEVTLRNPGLEAARVRRLRVYETGNVSTLPTPDRWRPALAETGAQTIDQGDVPRTVRLSASLDAGTPRCLIAVVEVDGSDESRVPAPVPKSAFDWEAYLDLVRNRGDVAICNCHEIALPAPGAKNLELPKFRIDGTPGAPRRFVFEVVQRLPEGVAATLTLPLALALKFSRKRLWPVRRNGSTKEATLHLPRQPRFRLGAVRLPSEVAFKECRFRLEGSLAELEPGRAGHSLAIRQLYRGEVVGQITWRFQC